MGQGSDEHTTDCTAGPAQLPSQTTHGRFRTETPDPHCAEQFPHAVQGAQYEGDVHDCVLDRVMPEHRMPHAPSMHARPRCWYPVPHDILQTDHGLQSERDVNTPATEKKVEWAR